MKISCLPVSLFPEIIAGTMDIKAWAQAAHQSGLDGIDMSVLFIRNSTPGYLRTIRKDIEAVGLPVVMMTAYPDFTNPDALQREREMEYFRHDIALASELGASYLRITAGQSYPETSVDNGLRWVIENFKRSAETAEKFGLELLFENHSKPGVWALPDFGFPTDIFLRIASRISDTGIGINFDTANPLAYGDDPLPLMEKVINQIVTIHASDTAVRGRLEPVLLGEGLVPFETLFKKIKQNRFDGWICIEEASRRGVRGIQEATAFVRKTWAAS